jgi:small-conductance mechanosensitive channel
MTSPLQAHGLTIVVRLEPKVAPYAGSAELKVALLSCNQILRTPPPTVTVRAIDAVATEYEIQFFVEMIEQGPAAQSEFFDLVFRHCASAGIRLAIPSASPALLPPRVTKSGDEKRAG